MVRNKLASITLLCAALVFSACYKAEAQMQDQNIKPAVHKKEYPKSYKKVTGDVRIMQALDCMIGTSGDYSRRAILGENLSEKPMKIYFTNLGSINSAYSNYDALGMKKGKKLYIYVNQKHSSAPPEALAALLSHEALHQDEYNSINEETYAWTMEATVWHELTDRNPRLKQLGRHPLVNRENVISRMLENANFSNRLIRNTVVNNPGYKGLPARSPGFESIN